EDAVRVPGDGEAGEQHVGHGDVEVGPAHGVVLVVQAHDRTGVVVLDVQQGEVVAQGVDHRQVGPGPRVLPAPRPGAVELVPELDEERLRGHGQHEVVA